MSELEFYEILVSEKANENSTEVLPNAGKEHATIVMAKMFEKTTDSVNMIVGSFDGSVSDNPKYLDKMESCLKRNIPFKILFLDDPNIESKAYKLLIEYKKLGSTIEFKQASEDVKELLKSKGEPIHFSVFDKNKYRFEKDTDGYKAWFCFNDSKNSEAFLGLFDRAFEKSV